MLIGITLEEVCQFLEDPETNNFAKLFFLAILFTFADISEEDSLPIFQCLADLGLIDISR
jgi:hypothetical protein